jgi:hypothetical protein
MRSLTSWGAPLTPADVSLDRVGGGRDSWDIVIVELGVLLYNI